MKKFLSNIIVLSLLFVSIVPCSTVWSFNNNSISSETVYLSNDLTDKIVLSKEEFLYIKKKLDSIDRTLNPTLKDKLLNALCKTGKSALYYVVVAALLAYSAQRAGYVSIPTTIEELKTIKLDATTGVYAVLGLLVSPFVSTFGKIFGIPSEFGVFAVPAIASGLSLYRTDAEPISALLASAASVQSGISNIGTAGSVPNAVLTLVCAPLRGVATVATGAYNWVKGIFSGA